MGFGLPHVLSDESHYREFVCKICLDLVELPAVYTRKCSHVFCNSCLRDWIKASAEVKADHADDMDAGGLYQAPWEQTSGTCATAYGTAPCPACKEPLVVNRDVAYLSKCEPLAYRLLLSVRCRCPLGGGCTWGGDYSELQAHLTNSDSHARGASSRAQIDKCGVVGKDAETKNGTSSVCGASSKPIVTAEQNGGAAASSGQQYEPAQPKSTSNGPLGGTGAATNSSIPSSNFYAQESNQPGLNRKPENAISDAGLQQAEGLKELGNGKYKAGAFQEATQLYSKALAFVDRGNSGTDGTSSSSSTSQQLASRLLANRGACWMALGAYKNAVQDCQESVRRDRNFAKAFIRLSSAFFLSGGTLDEAIGVLETRRAAELQSPTSADSKASNAFTKELSGKVTELSLLAAALIGGKEALQLAARASTAGAGASDRQQLLTVAATRFQRAHDIAVAGFGAPHVPPQLQLWLARAHIARSDTDKANVVTRKVLRGNRSNVDALTAQAAVLLLDGECVKALDVVKEALRLSPDNDEAQYLFRKLAKPLAQALDQGRACVSARDFENAAAHFETGIKTIEQKTKAPSSQADNGGGKDSSATNTSNSYDPFSRSRGNEQASEAQNRESSPVLRPVNTMQDHDNVPEGASSTATDNSDGNFMDSSDINTSASSASVGAKRPRTEAITSTDEGPQRGSSSMLSSSFSAASSAPQHLSPEESALHLGLEKSLLYSTLLSEAGSANFRLRRFEITLKRAQTALYIRPDFRDAVVLRANTLVALERYDEAVASLEGDTRLMFESDTRVQHAHQKAVFELRKSKRLDYYDLLSKPCTAITFPELRMADTENLTGSAEDNLQSAESQAQEQHAEPGMEAASPAACSSNSKHTARPRASDSYYKLSSFSTQADIKNAYKQRCLELHPDKHAGNTSAAQKFAKERFQMVGEAFEILNDEAKRKLWDDGYDKQAIEERIRAMHEAAHRNQGWAKHHHH
ncbi:unnamed protein product [Amoebophrya sp. A25]|nr:unnamed protein product [Amoebophrya sp. A25]|eukprot:GSA25T00001083001.1